MSLALTSTRFGAVAEDPKKTEILTHAQTAFDLKPDAVDLVVSRKATDTSQEVLQEAGSLLKHLKRRALSFLKTFKTLLTDKTFSVEPLCRRHGVSIVTHVEQPDNFLEKCLDSVTAFVASAFKRIGPKLSASWTTKVPQADGRIVRLETPLRLTPSVTTQQVPLPEGGFLKLRQFQVDVAPEKAHSEQNLPDLSESKAPSSSEKPPSPETPEASSKETTVS